MDTIFINGKISTLDKKNNIFEALAVDKGIIAAVGYNEEILKLKDNNTEIIDLQGKLMLPSFNDSHMHLVEYGKLLTEADLTKARSIEEVIEILSKFKKDNNLNNGEWIVGYGWNQDYFDIKRFPTKEDLDKVSLDNPIYITRACIHSAVVNSKALAVAGIDKNTEDVEGGVIEKDKNGEPNGILRENAMNLISEKMPKTTKEELKKIILKVNDLLLKSGITSVQSDDFTTVSDYEEIIDIYNELDTEGLLQVRVNEQCNMNLKDLKDFISKGYNNESGSNNFKFGPLKIISDGSLGARTAYLSQPYADDNSTRGILIYDKDELQQLVSIAHNNNMSVAIHCIGNEAMKISMDCIENAIKEKPVDNHRHGIVHCQITDETILKRFKLLNLTAYIQPIFIHYDQHILKDRVGSKLAKTSYNWKTLMDYGVVACGGSDCPVESFDIMNNLYCAITRKDLNGYPEDGYNKEQCLSVEEALRCFTINGAYASFEENVKGTLEPGKFADMVVLDKDIYNCEKDEIKDINILTTIVGGKIIKYA